MTRLLDDDLRRRLDELLDSCVQCGLCLPHCATYLATGSETQSPRGRLVLLDGLVRGDAEPDASTLEAFDLCLGCRACETACPSGIDPGLLQAARDAARRDQQPLTVLGVRLRPELMPLLRRAGNAGEAVVSTLAGSGWRRRLDGTAAAPLARMLGSRPVAPSRNEALIRRLDALTGLRTTVASQAPAPASTPTVTLFRGCANDGLLPAVQARLLGLLAAAGVGVEVPDAQTCCGALETHTGDSVAAADRRRRNADALADSVARTGVLLVEAAGCGLELKDAGTVAPDRVVDAVVLLDGLSLPPRRRLDLKVAYHDPCHARHGQGIVDQPRRLLCSIPGVQVLEPDEADVCCGSGGGYALAHSTLSEVMGRRKARHLSATGADLVVTANPGCLGQIHDALAVEGSDVGILPLTDLLWYACLA